MRTTMHPMGAFHPFAGLPEMKALEEKFLPAEKVKKKYDGAEGLSEPSV